MYTVVYTIMSLDSNFMNCLYHNFKTLIRLAEETESCIAIILQVAAATNNTPSQAVNIYIQDLKQPIIIHGHNYI